MNISSTLAKTIKKGVYAKQKNVMKGLVGKHIVRNGTKFLVVSVDKEKVIVSASGTDLEQTNTFNLKSFVSKKISVVNDEK